MTFFDPDRLGFVSLEPLLCYIRQFRHCPAHRSPLPTAHDKCRGPASHPQWVVVGR